MCRGVPLCAMVCNGVSYRAAMCLVYRGVLDVYVDVCIFASNYLHRVFKELFFVIYELTLL